MIPVYKPHFSKKVAENVNDAIESTWISSVGKWKDYSSAQLRDLLETENILLVNNGTAATHLVAKSLKFKRPTIKKVIVPNNVYVAAWNSLLYDRCLDLIPVDADEHTWNINISNLKNTLNRTDPREVAVLIVPNLGNIINVLELMREFPEHLFIEDNCEGLFGKYENSYAGTKSLASSISFYGNKTITSGEGGAVITQDRELYGFLERMHGQGQTSTRFIHDLLAHNYRMTNVQAAILSAQIEDAQWILNKKTEIFERYKSNLKKHQKVKVQKVDDNCSHSTWMFGIRIPNNLSYQFFREHMNNYGIEVRPMFYPMSSHTHLKKYANPKDESVAKLLSKECAILPSYPDLKIEQVDYICECLEKYCNK